MPLSLRSIKGILGESLDNLLAYSYNPLLEVESIPDSGNWTSLGLASIFGVWDLTLPAFVIEPWLGMSAEKLEETSL